MTREEAIKYAEDKLNNGLYRLDLGYLNRGLYQITAREVDFMRVAISALREQPRWISVEERLPERDEKCLCRYTFGEGCVMVFHQVLDYYATDPQPHFQHAGDGSRMRVTHWMPLPEPPEVEV